MMKNILFFLVIISGNLFSESRTILVYGGKTGWIGQKIVKILENEGFSVISGKARLENRESLVKEINIIQPDYIINAAGITGRPNIDWCEDHKQETIRTNVIGVLNLVDVAYLNNIHITHIGTGCIYYYDQEHPKNSGKGFTEEDKPNHQASFYCESKIHLEPLLMTYPNLLHLRIRMPISYDWNARNFIVKITGYERVINEPNSLSVLEDLLPVIVDMTLKGKKGNYNMANPGVLSHNEILALYKEIVDPSFTWKNFTVTEQNAILKAGRSNCELDVSKLLKEYPNIPDIKTSIIEVLHSMKKAKDNF